MTESLTIPHFGYADEVEVSALQDLRSSLKPVAAEMGIKLSAMPIMIKVRLCGAPSFTGYRRPSLTS